MTREDQIGALQRARAYTAEARENAMRIGMRWALEDAEREIDAVLAALSAPPPPAALVALVREWQEARKPAQLPAPGEFLAETFRAAVRRMSAADEALAAYDLSGPAGGALVGQTAPAESTGTSLRDELTEVIRWRFKSADGEPMNGPLILEQAREIADAIAPMIEEATGER